MSRAKPTMTGAEIALWEQRLKDGRLFAEAQWKPDGAPCLECGEPTRVRGRVNGRHFRCYSRWRYRERPIRRPALCKVSSQPET